MLWQGIKTLSEFSSTTIGSRTHLGEEACWFLFINFVWSCGGFKWGGGCMAEDGARCYESHEVSVWPNSASPTVPPWSACCLWAQSHFEDLWIIFHFKSKETWLREAIWGEKLFWTRTLKGHTAANSTKWIKLCHLCSSGAWELSAKWDVRWISTETQCGYSCACLYCLQSSEKENTLLYAEEWSLITWRNRDRRTCGRYFRSLAFEELSWVLCWVILGEMLTVQCRGWKRLSFRKTEGYEICFQRLSHTSALQLLMSLCPPFSSPLPPFP